MSATFPLLKLPYIQIKSVILQIDPVDVIELTMLSKKIKKHVQSFKLKADKLEWKLTESIGLSLTFNSSKMNITSWNCNPGNLRKINGNLMANSEIVINDNVKNLSLGAEDNTRNSRLKLLEEISNHLFSILKIHRLDLDYNINEDVRKLFVWKYSEQPLFELKVSGNQSITPEELTFLLENVKAKTLDLDVNLKKFKYKKSLKRQSITIRDLSWVDTDRIFELNCARIVTHTGLGYLLNFNRILKEWLSSENDAIENFHAYFTVPIAQQRMQIFDGINATPTVFTVMDLNRRTVRDARSPAMDIERRSDGLLATVVVSEYAFEMVVWQREHYKYCVPETKKRFGF